MIVFGFLFMLSIINDFRNKSNESLLDKNEYHRWLNEKLYEKVDLPAKVLKTANRVKSLILLELESFSNEFVQNPLVCPNLKNYSKLYEYIAPVNSEPYTTWSTAAMITLQTGLPQIIPETSWKTRGKARIEYFEEIKGLPDILKSFQYQLHFASTGDAKIMGFARWTRFRKYKRIYKATSDLDLYNYTKHYLIEMDKKIRKSKFRNHYLLFVANEETHSNYIKPKWCNYKFPNIEEKQKCFNCVDSLVGDFIRKFIELKMYEHTLLAVFSDHVPFARQMFSIEPKELFFLFPGMKKVDPKLKVTDDVTFYDFAPTILDLIGIQKYLPEFPFGRQIYNMKHSNIEQIDKHYKPDNKDLAIINKFLYFEKGKNIVSRYNLSQQFRCYLSNSKSFYYSDVPCNKTKVY